MELRLGPIAEVDAAAWDALVAERDPFVGHAFLASLEAEACTAAETGWQPLHARIHKGDALTAAAPLFVKGHSHGEFIYDWHWAAAAERSGRAYYPKLFCGPPFTPATGPRLLGPAADALPGVLRDIAERHGLGSVHVGCAAARDRDRLTAAGFHQRRLWQFHWINRGYRDFEDFLDALKRRKRKNIRQERRRAAETGWTFERIDGGDADDATWAHLFRFHRATFDQKGNWTTLTPGVFAAWRERLGDRTLLVLARDPTGRPAAGALFFRSDEALYGRYWGTDDDTPFVHFETCYYQGIEYAIERGLARFEPGAQGTHKIARGFDPAEVSNLHWFADPELARAIGDHLAVEAQRHRAEGEALARLSAFP